MVLKCSLCGEVVKARGLCSRHYLEWTRGATYEAPLLSREQRYPVTPCVFDGCDRPARTLKMCALHYRRKLRGKV